AEGVAAAVVQHAVLPVDAILGHILGVSPIGTINLEPAAGVLLPQPIPKPCSRIPAGGYTY
ncbi:MAG: hypothetical protein U1B80_10005, partial [Anaerolineaceae bacterium]|nr:hypothetical protein [Anaerolineaceae bacterium]